MSFKLCWRARAFNWGFMPPVAIATASKISAASGLSGEDVSGLNKTALLVGIVGDWSQPISSGGLGLSRLSRSNYLNYCSEI